MQLQSILVFFKGKIDDGSNGDVADDHYCLYEVKCYTRLVIIEWVSYYQKI